MRTSKLSLIKKDIHSITSNKQVLTVMLMIPLVFTIVLPTIFVLVTLFAPDAMEEFEPMLEMISASTQAESGKQILLELMVNKIMPAFFMLIPIMASSVMAASSFVGEKEKRTLETLLYSPLSLKEIFQSKILAAFSVGMTVSLISFGVMMLVVELELFFLTGSLLVPDIGWVVVMLLIAPAISMIAIGITVQGSAKAQTIEEAQQRAVFLIFPVLALVIGQFSGVIFISIWLLLGIGILAMLVAAVMMRSCAHKFTYEKLLK